MNTPTIVEEVGGCITIIDGDGRSLVYDCCGLRSVEPRVSAVHVRVQLRGSLDWTLVQRAFKDI